MLINRDQNKHRALTEMTKILNCDHLYRRSVTIIFIPKYELCCSRRLPINYNKQYFGILDLDWIDARWSVEKSLWF